MARAAEHHGQNLNRNQVGKPGGSSPRSFRTRNTGTNTRSSRSSTRRSSHKCRRTTAPLACRRTAAPPAPNAPAFLRQKKLPPLFHFVPPLMKNGQKEGGTNLAVPRNSKVNFVCFTQYKIDFCVTDPPRDRFWGAKKSSIPFSIFACHPCAGAMLIFSVSFQF